MPVWHASTRQLVKDGKLVLLGVTQEQHPERCRLFAQYAGFDWPILHDPINVLESSAVPIVVAIDEHGIVRSTRPRADTFEKDFVGKTFGNAPDAKPMPTRYGPTHPPAFDRLNAAATAADSAADYRALGDALTLWGGQERLNDAIAAYATAVKRDAKDGPALFRLGVCLRRRYESSLRQLGDFQAAVENWGRALDVDPNQYIWRRRIQQYGPRLDKPYPFYDWVGEAEAAIRKQGETPIELPFRPDGAEIAKPSKGFEIAKPATAPDPNGKVTRVDPTAVTSEVTVVPGTVKAGQTARVHVVLHLNPKSKLHWNNESEPLRVWLDPPDGWAVDERLLSTAVPLKSVTGEDRRLEFEIKVPAKATGVGSISGYALFHVCDDDGGQCRFVRRDVSVVVTIGK